MSLDDTQRTQVLRATAGDAAKLLNHDGASFIAITLTTLDGHRTFFMSTETADQLTSAIRTALESEGLKPFISP